MRVVARAVLLVLVAAGGLWLGPWAALAQRPASTTDPAAPARLVPPITFDVSVLDRAGSVPDALAPVDLTVTIDGRVRRVLWTRRISRGPGAMVDASARAARSNLPTAYGAEPGRVVLIVVDESSFPPGGRSLVIKEAAAFLDRFGITDRVSVARVPLLSGAIPAPSAERPQIRAELERITGRVPPDEIVADGVTPDYAHVAGDPIAGDKASRSDRPERPEQQLGGIANPDGSLPAAGDALDGLIRTLKAMAGLPGRKTVAFYSAGLDVGSSSRLGEATRALAEVRARLYVFGIPSSSDGRYTRLDVRVLERLARSSGGVFVALGRNAGRDLDRLTPELSSCFEIGVERTPSDDGRGVVPLRVESRRADLEIRAASMAAPGAPPAGDLEPAPTAVLRLPPPASPEGYRGGGRVSPGAPALPPEATGGADVNVVLGRLSDYVDAYLGQYSALVAEEDYRQSAPPEHRVRRLRSDLLFVRPEKSPEWVSFRDVFEVDGKPLRDRDDRLKRLFLAPRPETSAQLQAIKDESARYNIGSFERNINVPMYPVKFLVPENRRRFAFTVGRASETAGVKTWRLDYVELGSPTLVSDRDGRDVPVQGRFMIERATGAIVESVIDVDRRDYVVSIVVRYVRDSKLGLWVPSEMKETYRIPYGVGPTFAEGATILEGTARYSRFRRFQVSTEEKIAIPK